MWIADLANIRNAFDMVNQARRLPVMLEVYMGTCHFMPCGRIQDLFAWPSDRRRYTQTPVPGYSGSHKPHISLRGKKLTTSATLLDIRAYTFEGNFGPWGHIETCASSSRMVQCVGSYTRVSGLISWQLIRHSSTLLFGRMVYTVVISNDPGWALPSATRILSHSKPTSFRFSHLPSLAALRPSAHPLFLPYLPMTLFHKQDPICGQHSRPSVSLIDTKPWLLALCINISELMLWRPVLANGLNLCCLIWGTGCRRGLLSGCSLHMPEVLRLVRIVLQNKIITLIY